MRVITCTTDHIEALLDLAWEVNGQDPLWIPPLRPQLKAALLGQDWLGTYAKEEVFAVLEHDRIVARAAAIINPRLRDAEGRPLGQVGFFEAHHHPQAVGLLFQAVEAWLRAQGTKSVMGPMNGGAQALHRLMISGFDETPFLFEPRNPAYYPTLFENAGYRPIHDWASYDFTEVELEELERRVTQYLKTHPHSYRVNYPDPKDVQGVLGRIAPLLDQTWAHHIGYGHLDPEEVVERNAGLLSILTTGDLRIVVDAQGHDVGFSLGYPDYSAEVRGLNGNPTKWGTWLGQSVAPRWVHHTIAVVPRVQDGRAAFLLFADRIPALRQRGFSRQIGVLANPKWRLYEGFVPSRRYALYGKSLVGQ